MPSADTAAKRSLAHTAGWVALVLLAAVAYATARVAFTHEYSAVPWKRLLALQAPLPFGHRVLVPWLAAPVVESGVPVRWVFGVVEALSFSATLLLTSAAARVWLPPLRARAAALAVGAALVLVYIVPRRWPLLYPWDGPAIAVLGGLVWSAARRHYRVCVAIAAIGALNRETAALAPLLVLALHMHDREQRPATIAWAQLCAAVVIIARVGVALALPDLPGPPLHFTIGHGSYRVLSNLGWLGKARNWAWLLVYVGVLPLLWPAVARKMPRPLHRVALVGAAFFVASMVVANVYEPRAWGEAVYLTSLASVIALLGARDAGQPPAAWLRALDRYAVLVFVVAFTGFVLALRAWGFLPVAQWPMPR